MSQEHEQRLLGCILLDPVLLDGEGITAELFTDSRNRIIFDAMRAQREAGNPVDLISVADSLDGKLKDAGGVPYLASLSDGAVSAANAVYYLAELRGEWRARELKKIVNEVTERLAAREEPEEIESCIEKAILKIRTRSSDFQSAKPADILHAIVAKAEARAAAQEEGCTGVPSGFAALDRLTGGFQASDLILIAARTSVGKTSLALSFIDEQITREIPVALASLEMSAMQVWERLLGMRSGVSTGRLRFGHLNTDDFRSILSAANSLESSDVRIIDKPDLNIRALRSWAFQSVGSGARILYVDYAGLLQTENLDIPRWERMAEVSRGLKMIARELCVPLVCLVQLNREAASQGEPGLHNLRDSGAFEQDADLVILLKRKDEKDGGAEEMPGEMIIAKQRNGPTGHIPLMFRKAIARFREAQYE